jgi:hypothetical protein
LQVPRLTADDKINITPKKDKERFDISMTKTMDFAISGRLFIPGDISEFHVFSTAMLNVRSIYRQTGTPNYVLPVSK